MEILKFKNVVNCRDLGGYNTPDGVTKKRIFLRSDLIADMSEEEIAYLKREGLSTVIDLRMPQEVEYAPNILAHDSDINYDHISLFSHFMRFNVESDMPIRYLESLENHAAIIKIFNILINSEGTVLYHCTAGKDRTGIISALILALCGVEREDIVKDYAISKELLTPKEAMFNQTARADYPAFIGNSKPEYISAFLDMLNAKYGGVEGYFEMLNLDVSGIKRKLV